MCSSNKGQLHTETGVCKNRLSQDKITDSYITTGFLTVREHRPYAKCHVFPTTAFELL